MARLKSLIGAALEPLKFSLPEQEQRFFQYYCLDRILSVQVGIVFGSLVIYGFFIWDRTIDPAHSDQTQAIRGLIIVPGLWVAASLLFIKSLHKWMEVIVTFAAVYATSGLSYIASILSNGLDYAEPGLIIQYLFIVTFLLVRVSYYFIMIGMMTIIWELAQIHGKTNIEGIIFLNNIYTAAAVLLCMISVTSREIVARRRFLDKIALEQLKNQIESMLRSMLPAEEIARLMSRQLSGTKKRIAISYRRADSEAMAGRIRDRLALHFGAESIFMDIDNIPFGQDFRDHISSVLKQTDVLLAIIGPKWLGVDQAGGNPRMLQASDPVRVEIETALSANVAILPILIGGALMPNPSDLPESIQRFAFRNAAEVQAGRDYNTHIERLLRAIDDILQLKT